MCDSGAFIKASARGQKREVRAPGGGGGAGGDTCEVVRGGGRLDARYELSYGDCSFYHNVNMQIFCPFK